MRLSSFHEIVQNIAHGFIRMVICRSLLPRGNVGSNEMTRARSQVGHRLVEDRTTNEL